MAVELALAIEAVTAVGSLVKAATDAAQNVRSGFLARNDGARQELQAKLAELSASLQQASVLAHAAEAYSRTHEEVAALLQACKRLEAFVNSNLADLTDDKRSGRWDAAWRLTEVIFDAVKENQSVPRSVLLDRAKWYDEEDKNTVDLRLNDFSGVFRDASNALNNRFARDLRDDLRRMISHLEDVEVILTDTMYGKILHSLEEIA